MAILSRDSTRPTLSASRARQGRVGLQMVWVLVVSTGLAALALFAAWSWRADDLASTAPNNAREAADATAFNMGDPAAQQTTPSPNTAPR
ncbi:MAG: hypothetical protein V4820_21360 [Pseudomonadota bacterium]|uniref:hypothetical protein n=1 Tax=Phenylobacterium sp. TaxID=1871053 RepID=UPI00271AB447|nr:hypothetical protein [Phenylobacterium sp.]MDO9431330.1 hypothetical protein [Phenylobacterium sp.]